VSHIFLPQVEHDLFKTDHLLQLGRYPAMQVGAIDLHCPEYARLVKAKERSKPTI
jgi:hypothetical protein